MKFICYPKCTTCMKAKKWLENNKIAFEERNISTENPSFEELKMWYKLSNLPLKKFFNTSGLMYKELNLKDKLKDMSEEEMLKLLSTNGMLIKRPIIVKDETILVGFKENEWEEKLK